MTSPVSLFSDLLNDNFFRPMLHNEQPKYVPLVNIIETEEEVKISVVAPGFSKGDFQLEWENDALKVSAMHTEEKVDAKHHRTEYRKGSFERSFNLTKDWVNPESVQAVYENGLLNISLAKKKKPESALKKVIPVE